MVISVYSWRKMDCVSLYIVWRAVLQKLYSLDLHRKITSGYIVRETYQFLDDIKTVWYTSSVLTVSYLFSRTYFSQIISMWHRNILY